MPEFVLLEVCVADGLVLVHHQTSMCWHNYESGSLIAVPPSAVDALVANGICKYYVAPTEGTVGPVAADEVV